MLSVLADEDMVIGRWYVGKKHNTRDIIVWGVKKWLFSPYLQ